MCDQSSSSEDNGQLIVVKILDKKIVRGKIQYKVKLFDEDYGEYSESWINKDSLCGDTALIEKFEKEMEVKKTNDKSEEEPKSTRKKVKKPKKSKTIQKEDKDKDILKIIGCHLFNGVLAFQVQYSNNDFAFIGKDELFKNNKGKLLLEYLESHTLFPDKKNNL